jgi:acyl carrier protein
MDARSTLRAWLIEDLFFGDPGAALADDDDLFELGLDSMGITRLVVRIERELGVRIPDADIVAEHWQDLTAIAALVASRA